MKEAGVAVTAVDELVTVQETEAAAPLVRATTTFGFGVTLLPETTAPLDGLQATLKLKAGEMLNVTVVVRDCRLFVPVTTTRKVVETVTVKVHDNVVVALGGRVTLDAIVQAVGLLDDNATIPLKPVEPPTLIVAPAATPLVPEIGPLFERAKLETVNENCGLAA